MTLVDKLIEIQKQRDMTDGDMGKALGITRPAWSYVRNGKSIPGRKVLEGVIASFPELTQDVLFFLQSRVGKTTTDVA
jgi:transcriptional regulator with XRE-family HTH domain